ncbi:MAG: TrkH family potassium uptake protein [Pseudomonadota bacterium]
MHLKTVAYLMSLLLAITAAAMGVPAAVAAAYGEHHSLWALLGSVALTGGIAGGLRWWARGRPPTVYRREAVAVVGLSWIAIAVLGGLPFLLDGSVDSLVDSTFEAASGFTTTGATILVDIEKLSHALLLWRSMTHWLGGMGIIVLFVAIFPQLGVGARRLFGAEVPGPITEGLRPKIRETSSVLWRIYLGLTVIETLALWACGLDLFEAVNHAFATMATGGFSTRNASVAAFQNPAAEWVIVVFMLAAGVNFSLYFAVLRGRWIPARRDVELRTYLALTAVASVLITVDIWGRHASWHDTIRAAVFQTVSIVTTTGFGTDNFDTYPAMSKIILVALMFVGASAGSTAGGIKVSRIVVVWKAAWAEVVRTFHPQGVVRLRLGEHVIPEGVVRGILAFFGLFIMLFVLGSVCMAALGLDLITAVTSVAATLGNIGPGLGRVGSIENYAFVPPAGKLVLTVLMILGRLELTTLLALVSRALWVR